MTDKAKRLAQSGLKWALSIDGSGTISKRTVAKIVAWILGALGAGIGAQL